MPEANRRARALGLWPTPKRDRGAPGRLDRNAARRIATLKAQEAPSAFLRIAVSGGCSGFQYGLSFDDERNDDDSVFERDGIAVVIDDVSLGLLNGAEVDFVEDLMGASFQIKNPNAASSCGCGNSFSVG
jgi:iron-sulfur cluster insertion protein